MSPARAPETLLDKTSTLKGTEGRFDSLLGQAQPGGQSVRRSMPGQRGEDEILHGGRRNGTRCRHPGHSDVDTVPKRGDFAGSHHVGENNREGTRLLGGKAGAEFQ